MNKTYKNKKRPKLWRCIDCDCHVDHGNRRFHKGHRGRWGTPTTAFYEKSREVTFTDGSTEWHPNERVLALETKQRAWDWGDYQ